MASQPIPEPLYLTTYQVAQRLSCTAQHVRDLIADGTLRGERGLGRKILVPASELRRMGLLGELDLIPGHEGVSSAPDNRETVRELRRLYAEMGRLLAEL